MKAELIEDKEEFKPVTLKLTFESQKELNTFFAVCNTNEKYIYPAMKEGYGDSGGEIETSEGVWAKVKFEIYQAINQKVK